MNIEEIKAAANTVRGLSMDGVQAANSGHPGLPMGAADFATVLWTQFLNHNPKNPEWFNRDRFVLSGGHGSMLIYSLLHLTGYDLSLADLKNFRQWESKTPGHPEYGDTPGVETTTGPLGQGISNAVGMAIAEHSLAARFNQPEYPIIDHYTYVILGDGDLQEGVSHEASALAGHLKLGKLIALYDDNDVTIDGKTDLSFTENVAQRYEAYGWHTLSVDGHDIEAVNQAIEKAKQITDKPSFISCKTIIGKGSPNKAGTSTVHGSPLGEEEITLSKQLLGLPDEKFYVSQEANNIFGKAVEEGQAKENQWNELFANYQKEHADLGEQFMALGQEDFDNLNIEEFVSGQQMATRSASGAVLDQIAPAIPSLVGGSADLTPSNNTFPKSESSYSPNNPIGRYFHYGVREHGMGSIMNGMALHGGMIPYAGTFFVFTDYMRPAMRMAALMGIRVIYVLTHDSIGLGEDGPTHQPIAHLTSLRAMPNMTVIRPADANETAEAWKMALKRNDGPTCLVLTRQKLPVFDRSAVDGDISATQKGGYILSEDVDFEAILIASGSEVELAMKAKEELNAKGHNVRVVSMPCTNVYDAQDDEYKESILPTSCPTKIAIEAGATLGWHKYVGTQGEIIGLDRFGASAPYQKLYEEFGLTSNAITQTTIKLIEKRKG